MYVVSTERPVAVLERELADDALVALGVQTLLAGFWVALVSVYLHRAECAFGVERRGVLYGLVGRPEEFWSACETQSSCNASAVALWNGDS
jgi:hypothetical protein